LIQNQVTEEVKEEKEEEQVVESIEVTHRVNCRRRTSC
jgi:hypothetical protein